MTLKYQPFKFNSRKRAFAFANHCEKAMVVILGDDAKFWVVCLADAARMERAGYEWAD